MSGVVVSLGAGVIFVGLLGAFYTAAAADRPGEVPSLRLVSAPRVEAPPAAPEPALPEGAELTDELAAAIPTDHEDIVDPISGMRIGAFTFLPPPEPEAEPEPERSRARERRRERRPPVPRLHPDPGIHVVMTARQMNARGERISGSCYRYISEVYDRAGHDGWRSRRVVYQGNRNGPYADLSLIRPGDWLYIVNHPNRTPVGTHSVLFVGWENRARGYARVIEHPGWGSATTGRERGYDVSRTYRITRPVLGR